jgi:hypothetical protein
MVNAMKKHYSNSSRFVHKATAEIGNRKSEMGRALRRRDPESEVGKALRRRDPALPIADFRFPISGLRACARGRIAWAP